MNKYFSQMVVECHNREDNMRNDEVVDSDFENNNRFTIKNSWVRKPNAVLDTWNEKEVKPKNTIVQQNARANRLVQLHKEMSGPKT